MTSIIPRIHLLLLSFFWGTDLWACAVCDAGETSNRTAFYFTTALLTFAPLIMLGGGAWYIWRKSKDSE